MNSKQIALVALGLLLATPTMGLGLRQHHAASLKNSMAQVSSPMGIYAEKQEPADVNNQDPLPAPTHAFLQLSSEPDVNSDPTDIPPSHEENLIPYDTNPLDIPEPVHSNMRIEFDTNN